MQTNNNTTQDKTIREKAQIWWSNLPFDTKLELAVKYAIATDWDYPESAAIEQIESIYKAEHPQPQEESNFEKIMGDINPNEGWEKESKEEGGKENELIEKSYKHYRIVLKQRDELVKEIEQLKERVEKLREALQDIKDMETGGSRFDVLQIVNKALQK